MLNKYEDKYRNFEILMSLKNINNNKMMNDLKEINEMNIIKNKVENILNIYDKMNYHVITMIYKVNNEEKIKLFNPTFVENNKDLCSIIYENQEYRLTDHLNTKDINGDKIEIRLKGINNVKTMKAMFYECNLLESLPDISNWDTKNVNDMSYLFYKCLSLKSFSGIYKWNTSNVTNMECMFYECVLLQNLPDISKWNTKNLRYMSYNV